MSELDAKFQVAVDFIATKGSKLTNEQVGRFYRHLTWATQLIQTMSSYVPVYAAPDAVRILQASAFW